MPAYQVMSLWLAGSGKFSQFVSIRHVGSASALGRGVRAHHGFSDSGIRKVIATGIATTQSAAIIQNAIPPKCW